MAQIHIKITLDNIDDAIDASALADKIENIVNSFTKMETSTTIYDNDSKGTSNPIMTHNTLKRVRR